MITTSFFVRIILAITIIIIPLGVGISSTSLPAWLGLRRCVRRQVGLCDAPQL